MYITNAVQYTSSLPYTWLGPHGPAPGRTHSFERQRETSYTATLLLSALHPHNRPGPLHYS